MNAHGMIRALASTVFVAACVAGCGRDAPKPAEKAPVAVTVMSVTRQDTPVVAVYVAQTQSSQAVNIQARVSGFLDKRVYVEGSVVKAGQVLFQMDQKPFQAQVDAQKAALARSQAAAVVAKQNLDRTKPLAAQNALSQKDLDDATGQYEQAAAAVEQGKAQLEEAQLNLSYTTITSPVTGVSSFAAIADGTYLSPQNSQLTTVSVLTPMWVNFSISENEMTRIRDDVQRGLLKPPPGGQYTVEIELVDGSTFPYSGRITFADPSYNSQTGTFLIRATVDNPTGALRPNQYVRARIRGAVRPNAIVIPQRAVQQGAKGQFVWVVDKDNQAELRPVSVGEWHGEQWFVTEGLDTGDRVVVDGAQRLAPGVKVAATPYVPPKAVAGTPAAANATATKSSVPASATANASSPAATDTSVYFASGKSNLDETAMRVLRQKSAELMAIGTQVRITGYTDPHGKTQDNAGLAKRRAQAVRDALVQLGIEAERIRLEPPANITGSGSDDQARRVDIVITQ
jgi:membrane fusion protein (multidrug efflux system)